MSLLRNPSLGVVTRLFVGGLFVYASLDKIAHPDAFARIVFNYHLVSAPLINIFALFLPWVELGAGLFLIIGVWPRASAMVLVTLTLVFIVALSVNWFRGVNLDCGCFTVSSKAKGAIGSLIIRDIGLLLLGIQAMIARPLAWISRPD